MRIRIAVGEVALEAELNVTATAAKIGEALPIRSSFNTWGDEIYFSFRLMRSWTTAPRRS